MKWIKNIGRFLMLLVVAVVLAAIVLPFVFEDELKQELKTALNESLDAKVDFYDIDLSFFNSFPQVGLTVDSLTIDGINEFDGVRLAAIDKAKVEIGLASLLNKSVPVSVREITLTRPQLNVIQKRNGKANYNIVKKSNTSGTEEALYVFDIDSYRIVDGDIAYTNHISGQSIKLKDVDHSGKGTFSDKVFDAETTTDVASIDFVNNGIAYMSKGTLNGNATVNVDLNNNKYTLKKNSFRLNALDFSVVGWVQLLEQIKMDLKLDVPSEDARGILSVIPAFYNEQFAQAEVSGNTSTSAWVKGSYDGQSGIYPAFNLKTSVKGGAINYPDLPKSISDLNLELEAKAGQGNLDDLIVNIPDFNLKLGANAISGALRTSDLSKDGKLEGYLKGNILLQDWLSSLPMDSIETLSGEIFSDFTFAGSRSDIESGNYKALKLDGELTGKNIAYQAQEGNPIRIASFESDLSPRRASFSSEDMQLGSSTMDGTIVVDNPLALLTKEKTATRVEVTSPSLDLNEWTDTESENRFTIPEHIADIDFDMTGSEILYDDYRLKDVKLLGAHKENTVHLHTFSGYNGESDFNLSGELNNALGYFNRDETITGNLELNSAKIDIADWQEDDGTTTRTEGIVPVPAHMDVTIKPTIAKLNYGNITLENMQGNLYVKDQQAVLENGRSDGFNGKMAFEGSYDTSEEQPEFSFKYDLSKLDFAKTFATVEWTRAFVPLMKELNGEFNSTLVMDGKLTNSMSPDLSTLNAAGYLETISAKLKDIDFSNKLADLLGIEEIRKMAIEHTKNWFEIKDGMFIIKPFTYTYKGIDLAISGRHGLKEDMDYRVILDVPRTKFSKNSITNVANEGLKLIEKEAKKLGINIDQGDYIKLRVDISGTAQNPSFKVTPLGSGGKATLEDIVKDEIDKAKKTVVDSVNTIIDSVETVVNDTLNKLKDQAEKVVEEVKDSVKTIVDEVQDSAKAVIDETIETVTDSAQTKIEEVVNDQLDKILEDSTAQEVKDEISDIVKDHTGMSTDSLKQVLKDWDPFNRKKKKKKKEKDNQ